MAYRDLSEFLTYLDKRGVLRRVDVSVSRDLELTAIAARAHQLLGGSPALLFENIVNSAVPILLNGWDTPQLMAWGLGLNSLSQLTQIYRDMLALTAPGNDKLSQLGTNSDLARFAPRTVKSGPCQEIIKTDQASFDQLPLPQFWANPSQRMLTNAQIFYRDPHTSKIRLTLADLTVTAPKRAVLTPHLFKLTAPLWDETFAIGTRFPIACVVGGDPALTFAALAPLPPLFDGLTLAGYMRRIRIETVKGQTQDIEAPAQAEIVLEGVLTRTALAKIPNSRTGFQHSLEGNWSFELSGLTQRKTPILPLSVPGLVGTDNGLLKANELALLPLLQQLWPEISDLSLPPSAMLHHLAIVAINKSYAGHAQQVMHALWATNWLNTLKTLVVLDADCNIQDPAEVLWRVAATLNPRHDLLTWPGLLAAFDHNAFGGFGTKLGIDATRKFPGESQGVGDNVLPVQLDPQTRELVNKKWPSYGLD